MEFNKKYKIKLTIKNSINTIVGEVEKHESSFPSTNFIKEFLEKELSTNYLKQCISTLEVFEYYEVSFNKNVEVMEDQKVLIKDLVSTTLKEGDIYTDGYGTYQIKNGKSEQI